MSRYPYEAIAYAKQFVKSMPLERVAVEIVQDAYNYMWFAAPWRWSVGAGMEFNLVGGQYEYIFTAGSGVPSDYLYVISATLITNDNSQTNIPLEVVSVLPTTGHQGTLPTKISELPGAVPGTSVTYRVHPVKPQVSGTNKIVTIYKRKPFAWDAKTIHTTAVQFPDEWFYVFKSLVLHHAYKFSNDDRAGGATVNPEDGSIVFNGQRAAAEAELLLMKTREKPLLLLQIPVQERGDFKK